NLPSSSPDSSSSAGVTRPAPARSPPPCPSLIPCSRPASRLPHDSSKHNFLDKCRTDTPTHRSAALDETGARHRPSRESIVIPSARSPPRRSTSRPPGPLAASTDRVERLPGSASPTPAPAAETAPVQRAENSCHAPVRSATESSRTPWQHRAGNTRCDSLPACAALGHAAASPRSGPATVPIPAPRTSSRLAASARTDPPRNSPSLRSENVGNAPQSGLSSPSGVGLLFRNGFCLSGKKPTYTLSLFTQSTLRHPAWISMHHIGGLEKNQIIKAINESFGLLHQLSGEIRTLSHLLHPPLLDEVGLASPLQLCVQGFGQRSRIHVDLEIQNDFVRLSRELETSIFRIVQECLTNFHRHSGSPVAKISIRRERNDRHDQVCVLVEDQGKSLSPKHKGQNSTEFGVGTRGCKNEYVNWAAQWRSQPTLVALVPLFTVACRLNSRPLQHSELVGVKTPRGRMDCQLAENWRPRR